MSTTYQKGNGNRQQARPGTEIAPPKIAQGLIASMAAARKLDPAKYWEAVKYTVFSGDATDAEMLAFMTVCDHYGLEPFRGEIFAFRKKGGGIQPIVSIDGWSSIINRNPQFDGMSFDMELDAEGKINSVTCTMYRKDRNHPTSITEFYRECNRPTEPWKQWPARMLRHKAMIQCARIAFGLSGISDPDEAERMAEVGAIIVPSERLEHRPMEQRTIEHQPQETLAAQDTDNLRQAEPVQTQREPGDEPDSVEAPTFESLRDRIVNAVNAKAMQNVMADAARAQSDGWIDQRQMDELMALRQEAAKRK